MEDPDGEYLELSRTVNDDAAVCDLRAGAHVFTDAVDDAVDEVVDKYERAPSIRDRVTDGYEIMTF